MVWSVKRWSLNWIDPQMMHSLLTLLLSVSRLFSVKGREVSRCEFPSGGSYSSAVREGSFDLHGDRVLRLGVNMYEGELRSVLSAGRPAAKTCLGMSIRYTMNHPEETHTSRNTCAQVTRQIMVTSLESNEFQVNLRWTPEAQVSIL